MTVYIRVGCSEPLSCKSLIMFIQERMKVLSWFIGNISAGKSHRVLHAARVSNVQIV